MRTTWFIPGHSIETFPEQTKMVVDAGHEIGVHGYSHENPIAMTPEQEETVMLTVHRPDRARRRPAPDRLRRAVVGVLAVTNELLLKHGIKYDHSLMHNDFTPYYVRVGDSWTKIDYSQAGRGVDEAAAAGRGDRSDRDPGQLVPRRPARR